MEVVLDASFIFPTLVEEDNSARVREIRSSFTKLFILDLLHIEIANALASAIRQRRLTAPLATKLQMSLGSLLPITTFASQYLDVAFGLARDINHSVYDCLYAVAARDLGATLVTCDAKVAAKLDSKVYHVKVV